jgi:hypothetical protein
MPERLDEACLVADSFVGNITLRKRLSPARFVGAALGRERRVPFHVSRSASRRLAGLVGFHERGGQEPRQGLRAAYGPSPFPVIGRNFRQPEQGLGFDNSPVAHMWRAMIRPAKYL